MCLRYSRFFGVSSLVVFFVACGSSEPDTSGFTNPVDNEGSGGSAGSAGSAGSSLDGASGARGLGGSAGSFAAGGTAGTGGSLGEGAAGTGGSADGAGGDAGTGGAAYNCAGSPGTNHTYDTATPVKDINECDGQQTKEGRLADTKSVDWYSYHGTDKASLTCIDQPVDPSAKVESPYSMEVCVFVTKPSQDNPSQCDEGTFSNELASTGAGYVGCCGTKSAKFKNYHGLSHKTESDVLIRVSKLQSGATCAPYTLEYRYGS